MRKRKFNVEENLYDLVVNTPNKDFPAIGKGHLWDFRQVDESLSRKVKAQGTKQPFPIPSCAKELQRYKKVTEIRNQFQESVNKHGIQPPKECLNRWLFNQLAIPRPEDELTIFPDSNSSDTNQIKDSSVDLQADPLLRCPQETEILQTQLLENLPAPIDISWKLQNDLDTLKQVYCDYIASALKWITKWNAENLKGANEQSFKTESDSIHERLARLVSRIQRCKNLVDFEMHKMEVLELCSSTFFTERFVKTIDKIINEILILATDKNDTTVESNPTEEKVIIMDGVNNQKVLQYQDDVLAITGLHYLKLKELFRINSGINQDAEEFNLAFHRALYVLARRYATFFGDNEGDGFHAAAPESAFEVMRNSLGVVQELFASPFNCHFGLFCSAFPDIDCWFGSCGSFFDFVPISGSYEVGPPYVAGIMDQTAEKLEELLSNSEEPLSFIVFVPEWKDPIAKYHLVMEGSKFLKLEFVMGGNDHAYIVGDQHTSATRYVKLPFRTCVYILQNSAGATKWPVTKSLHKQLQTSLRGPIEQKKQQPKEHTRNRAASKNKKNGKRQRYTKLSKYQQPPKIHKTQ